MRTTTLTVSRVALDFNRVLSFFCLNICRSKIYKQPTATGDPAVSAPSHCFLHFWSFLCFRFDCGHVHRFVCQIVYFGSTATDLGFSRGRRKPQTWECKLITLAIHSQKLLKNEKRTKRRTCVPSTPVP